MSIKSHKVICRYDKYSTTELQIMHDLLKIQNFYENLNSEKFQLSVSLWVQVILPENLELNM